MLVDSHCHLDRLKCDDLDAALDQARARGVSAMLCVCISAENKSAVLDIASRHSDVYASVGVHPSDTTESVVSVAELKRWAQSPDVVAIGETGLDYYYTKDTSAQQLESFRNHLLAAGELKLPVIVHTRDARGDTIDSIKRFGSKDSAGVLHCFTESWEMAREALDLDYYISLSGIVTFKNAEDLRDVARKVPLDRLLVETDSPYLAPVPFRGKPNEPRYVREVAEFVAELRGLSFEALAEVTTRNFYTLFARAQNRS